MEKRFTMEGGGTLWIQDENGRVRLSCVHEADSSGLYKAWACGANGELLLGTLAPENGKLALHRNLSRMTFVQSGAWPVTGGRVEMMYAFADNQSQSQSKNQSNEWQRERKASEYFHDPILKTAAQHCNPILKRQDNSGFSLAVPFHPEQPFPMIPIFCFGETRQIAGQEYIIFSFDINGNPKCPSV